MAALGVQASLVAAQQLDQGSLIHSTRELASIVGSIPTAQRYVRQLEDLGFLTILGRGRFVVRSALFQPYSLWLAIIPSLQSLKEARYFGRSYNESDVHFARKKFSEAMVTLDYRSYELTGLQTPEKLFLYVSDQDSAAKALKSDYDFSEGPRGKIAILPRIGDFFDDEIQRVYLDSLAAGGRNLLDAVAIELRYPDKLRIKGLFQIDLVEKVREDLSNAAMPVTQR
jgi:DNA-binding transcriptional regulator YhcF (GntR family)